MAGIKVIEYVLPEQVITNEQLEKIFNTWSAEKIYQKTGIKTRHVVKGETALDLAVQAAEKFFLKSEIKKEEIDYLIYISQSPEYILPSSACLLQEKLNLNKHIGAIDINLGCSGYIYGLGVAKGLVESNIASNILLITADSYSKYIHPLDKSTRTIFGDAATITLIGSEGWQIGEFDFGSDGSGRDLFIIPAGGMKYPKSTISQQEYERDGNIRTDEHIYMDGPGIFEFTIREIPRSINNLLEKACLMKEDIDMFILHQANRFMLEFLRKQMKIDEKKWYMNFSDIGNTVSSSIPIALKRAMQEGKLEQVDTMLLSGFGVGLSWGTTILRKEKRND